MKHKVSDLDWALLDAAVAKAEAETLGGAIKHMAFSLGRVPFCETPLIAAMRAYVASKFGEEVEL